MNPPRDAAPPGTSMDARYASLAQWKQLMRRYPVTSPLALASPVLTALVANAMTARLLMSGRMTPFELVVLVALEAVLLIGVGWLQGLGLPRGAIEKNPMPMRERLLTFGFGLLWLGGVYAIVFVGMVPSGDEILRAARDPSAFLAHSTLKWPLLVTAAGALLDVLRDAAHFRRHGGTFISTPGFNGAARWLTLFLGGIPLFVPLVALLLAIGHAGKRLAALWKRLYDASHERAFVVLVVMVPLLAWLVPAGIGRLGAWLEPGIRGVGGWAMCYASAKFTAELFIICLPLIASRAHAEEAAALADPVRTRPGLKAATDPAGPKSAR